MIFLCIREGFRSARRNPCLVALLWFWTATMSALLAIPAWAWLGGAFDFAPESDRLLSGFHLGIMKELTQYDRSPVQGILMTVLLVVLLVSLLSNPLLAGGMIETLRSRKEDGSTLQRFCLGAGRCYWPFLRLLVYSVLTAAIVLAIIGAIFARVTSILGESQWEPAPLLGALARSGVLLVAGALLLLALDFARIRTAMTGSPRTLRTWFRSLGFVLRHAPAAFTILFVPVAAFGILAAVYLSYRLPTPSTWILILLTILIQQAIMFVRTGLRVALVGSEIPYVRLSGEIPVLRPVTMEVSERGMPFDPVSVSGSSPGTEPQMDAASPAGAPEAEGAIMADEEALEDSDILGAGKE